MTDELAPCLYSCISNFKGGNFNKLRKKQTFLEKLLQDNVEEYVASSTKRQFVKENILDKIPGGLKIFSKEKGEAYTPDLNEAFDRVSQKIRDIKKRRIQVAMGAASRPRRVTEKRTSKPLTSSVVFFSNRCVKIGAFCFSQEPEYFFPFLLSSHRDSSTQETYP